MKNNNIMRLLAVLVITFALFLAPSGLLAMNYGTWAWGYGGVPKTIKGAKTFTDNITFQGKILLPTGGTPAAPSFAFGDGNTGFYESGDNILRFVTNGTAALKLTSTAFETPGFGHGASIRIRDATDIIPVYTTYSDENTGIGRAGPDQLSLIAGGAAIAYVSNGGALATQQFIVSPGALAGAAATPSLAFGDGNTGFYEDGDNLLRLSIAGVSRALYNTGGVTWGGGGRIANEVPSSTNPVFLPLGTDDNTGIGWAGADSLSLISGGSAIINCDPTVGATIYVGLVIPSGTTPAPDVEGALFLDTDYGAGAGALMMYTNAWKVVADFN